MRIPNRHPTPRPRWARLTLLAAGVYNLAWGAWVVVFPETFFRLLDLEAPRYPALWQAIGMIVGAYGLGYLLASRNPLRHWPIVAVGLAGKVLGPIGFLWTVRQGELPAAFGWTIVPNDVVWWIPFAAILLAAWRQHRDSPAGAERPELVPRLGLHSARTQHGETLLNLSERRPQLIVFLRHLGCTFCRETLADLADERRSIETSGTGLVLVHMASERDAARVFASYGLEDVPRVADPGRVLYRALGLERGTLRQLFGISVLRRAVRATLAGHILGRKAGDGRQLAGAFVVYRGRILDEFRHQTAADRPDFGRIATRAPEALRSARKVS